MASRCKLFSAAAERGSPTLPCGWQGLFKLSVKWFSSLSRQGTNCLFFFFFEGWRGGLYTDGSDWSKVLWEYTAKSLFMKLL